MLLAVVKRAEKEILAKSMEMAQGPDRNWHTTGDFSVLTWISEFITDYADHSRKFHNSETTVDWFVKTNPTEPHKDF